jgi:hypothetical protein
LNLLNSKTRRSLSAAAAAFVCVSAAIQPARADAVLDWNATAAGLPIPAPPVQARIMAAMHGAVHDAINAIEPRYEFYRGSLDAAAGASKDAAAASAAHGVLVALVPGQKGAFDTALAASLAKVADAGARDAGVAVGKLAADRMIAWRAQDKFNAKAEDKPGTAAGAWQRTPPGMAPGVLPQLGGMTPFALRSAYQFAAKGRPALSSAEFARDLEEVKRLGGRYSTARTAEQTAVAVFWSGNEIPQLNAAARAASQARKLSLHDNARLFALMYMAVTDTTVVAFKIKYGANDWRPITAARAGHGAIPADPAWESLLVTPPHPEYPSGHCIVAGATAQVLREFFQSDDVKFDYVFPPGLGMVRSYASFTQIEKEMEDARVWGGIHFRTTDEHSTELGRKIGTYAMASYLRPLAAPASKAAASR